MALGRENVVHIALTDAAAARRVASAIARWQAFIDPDAGLDGANAVGPGSTDDIEDEGNS
jgi:2-methylisocitrate lyase-like PEP mutase family enzyme